MARFSALLDACALVPITQADLLLRLAEAGLYRPLWNHRILEETVAAIEAVHPQTKASGSARRRVNTMNKVFLDACVDHWEPFVESVDLPDPDDRHVVAAAVRGRADLLVTANLKDFPVEHLAPLGIEVQSPDQFLMNQLDLAPQDVMIALQHMAQATQNPPMTIREILSSLERCGLSAFSVAAAQQLWRISP